MGIKQSPITIRYIVYEFIIYPTRNPNPRTGEIDASTTPVTSVLVDISPPIISVNESIDNSWRF